MKHQVLIAALALVSASASAADVAVPEKATTCFACHGQGGVSTQPMYPVLAGQYANYLEHALTEYKEGKRKNAIMGGQAAGLSKDEIHALAQYFGAQQGPLYTPSVHGSTK
ncbi:MAG: cytochrome c [Nevskiaceae bacterium]|nr:MAG: cytochrome c [Nevskiaceae bacterium]